MIRRCIAWLFCFSGSSVHAIDKTTRRRLSHMLPNWATQEELRFQQQQKQDQQETPRLYATGAHNTYKGVLQQQVNANANNINETPTSRLFRMPAEHEPVSMVIMAWDPFIGDMLTRIAQLVVGAGAEVYMMISNYEYYTAPDDLRDIVGLHPLHRLEYDSLWTRDYGPVIGMILENATTTSAAAISATAIAAIPTITTATTTNNGESGGGGILNRNGRALEVVDPMYRLHYSRPLDDETPCQLALDGMLTTLPISCRSTRLILDGGNLMFDGHGALFTTLATYHWNEQEFNETQVDEQLQQAFGVDTIHVLEYARIGTQPADGTGHIDMFAKILAPCVVIVAQTTDNDDDVNSIYNKALNEAAEYFEQLECQADTGSSTSSSSSSFYQVHRVPGWADDGGTWYTYTNSLTVGNTVIVPSYYNEELNVEAQGVYQTAAPHLQVEFVNADEIIHYGGAVHCLTREVPTLLLG